MSHGQGIGKRIAAWFRRNSGETHSSSPSVDDAPVEHTSVSVPLDDTGDTDVLHNAIDQRQAKFQIGQVVQHRIFDFRGVIFDVDPVFSNTDEWYEAIPEDMRPSKDQPYYHLFAENEKTHYVAYVSEGNLLRDDTETPVTHPDIPHFFELTPDGYELKAQHTN